MNNFIKRKQIRIKDFDYSSFGAYFITICTANRDNFFGPIVAANCVRLKISHYQKQASS